MLCVSFADLISQNNSNRLLDRVFGYINAAFSVTNKENVMRLPFCKTTADKHSFLNAVPYCFIHATPLDEFTTLIQ